MAKPKKQRKGRKAGKQPEYKKNSDKGSQ